MYQKLNLTMRVKQREHDYALYLNQWVIRSYKKMPSQEELDKQETAVMQTIKAYQEMMTEHEMQFSIGVEWKE